MKSLEQIRRDNALAGTRFPSGSSPSVKREPPPDEETLRDKGLLLAVGEGKSLAVNAYKYAAICRASENPEVKALAPLYDQIGATWEAQAMRIIDASLEARA